MTKGREQSTVNKDTRAVTSRFAVAIKSARERKGLSLQRLGDLTSTSASYINRLEKFERKNPSITVLVSLAEALDLDVWELLNLAYNEQGDNTPDIVDLFMSSDFSIDGVVVNDPGLRKTIVDLLLMIVYQLDEEIDYREIVPLIDLIKKFHTDMKVVLKEGA